MNEPLLTTREVAELLGLSPATVLRRWRAGSLPGYRLGSNVLRFDRGELDAWLAARRNRDDALRRTGVRGYGEDEARRRLGSRSTGA